MAALITQSAAVLGPASRRESAQKRVASRREVGCKTVQRSAHGGMARGMESAGRYTHSRSASLVSMSEQS